MPESSSVILFDGYCNFCSRTVDFVFKHDKKNYFLFAASQSESGKKLAADLKIEEVNSVILIQDQKIYRYSSAVLHIAGKLKFPFNLLKIFIVVPAFIRDFLYKQIAKNRYRWFGKRENCRLPSEEEKKRFLN